MKVVRRRTRSLETAMQVVESGIEKIVAEISLQRAAPPKQHRIRTRKPKPAPARVH